MMISDLSIKRPTLVVVVMLALTSLGIFSYQWLPIELFPNVEEPFITVITKYPGASPETVEQEVTKPLEEEINTIAGVKHISSSSQEGISMVFIEFHLEEKLNEVAQEVRSKIGSIRDRLPEGMEEPSILKQDTGSTPVASLALQSDTLDVVALSTLAEKKIKRSIETISGVAKVNLVGDTEREISVDIDPVRLDALGLGVDEVIAGLKAENVNALLGRLNQQSREYTMRISGKPETALQMGAMVIAVKGGRPVRLSEVAQVKDAAEERRSLGLADGKPALMLDIFRQSGANEIALVDQVKAAMARLKAELPEGTSLGMVRDGSLETRESVNDMKVSLILGGMLTIIIVFCFINSWRSTVITGLALPISVISSFIIMYFLGMSLNMLTLLGLSLAIGFLIDDAIVVRENIVRHMEMGKDHYTAAKNGTNEIGLAVLATTMSIVAVFIPVAFMKGIIGRYFFHFGLTVVFAVIISLFVSFSLDPMLSSRWHDPAIENKGRRRGLARLLERFNLWFEKVAQRYRDIMAWALDHRKTVMAVAIAAFAAGVAIFMSLEGSFMPAYDKGEFLVTFKTAPDASIMESSDRLQAILKATRGIQEVEKTYAFAGSGDGGPVSEGGVFVKLKDSSERSRDQFAVQQEFRERLQEIAGITFSIKEVGGHGDGGKPLEANLRGPDIALLKEYAARLKNEIAKIDGIVDMEVSLERDIPEYRIKVDRERAVNAGLNSGDIARSLGVLIGGEAVTTIEDSEGDAVDVRLRLSENLRDDPERVKDLHMAVARPDGQTALLPMADLLDFSVHMAPSEINRKDLSREVTISAGLDGIPIGTAVERVKEAAGRINLPPGYSLVFTGEAEMMDESFGYMFSSMFMAVLFVYLILAAQFESFLDPLSIMFSLPLAIVGMAGMLYLTGDTLNIMSLIGLILLMGLVTKNAILLVDYTKTLRERGMKRREALIEAGRTRLRPIMMTTLAMISGMLPLAFALGEGAGMRAPMARSVIGGLITSTALTLVVVPVMYAMLEDLKVWAGTHILRKGGARS